MFNSISYCAGHPGQGFYTACYKLIGYGKIVMANPDDKGQAELVADTDSEVIKIRVDGSYLAQALKACGGMVDFKLTNPSSPMLLSANAVINWW